jgi:hypothetical protein
VSARAPVLLAAFVLGAFTPSSASAQQGGAGAAEAVVASPVEVQARSDKAEVTVGERFVIELKATGPSGAAYTFPGEASTESFELRSEALVSPGRAGGGDEAAGPASAPGEPGVHRYEATVFALGEVRIPGIPVRYRLPDGTEGEAPSAPLTLKVDSLLPKDAAERKLADVRGPVGVSIGRAFWIVLAVALLAAAAIAYAWLRRRRKVPVVAAPSVPELPPDAEALRALDALAAQDLPARGEYRAFYIALTLLAKRYLERRLAAPVVEMTSAETLAFLRGHAHGGELLPVVRDLAEAADRIKFANGDGFVDEARRHLAAVRRLVGALEERLRPVVTEAAEGKAA